MSTPLDILADRIACELLGDLRQRKGFDDFFDSLGSDQVNGIHRTWVVLVKDLLPDAPAGWVAPRDRLPENYVDGRASRPQPPTAEILDDL